MRVRTPNHTDYQDLERFPIQTGLKVSGESGAQRTAFGAVKLSFESPSTVSADPRQPLSWSHQCHINDERVAQAVRRAFAVRPVKVAGFVRRARLQKANRSQTGSKGPQERLETACRNKSSQGVSCLSLKLKRSAVASADWYRPEHPVSRA